jgi:hypothetical protein
VEVGFARQAELRCALVRDVWENRMLVTCFQVRACQKLRNVCDVHVMHVREVLNVAQG